MTANSKLLRPCAMRARLVHCVAAVIFATLSPSMALSDAGLDLQRYSGKIVLLDFWGSWCPACVHTFPWMNAMQKKYENQGLIVVAVNNDLEKEDGLAFLREHPAEFEIVWDQEYVLARKYKVQAMPASFLLGPDGEILSKTVGFKRAQQDEYEAEIVAALAIL
jgi:thiol-disulfide isomerase/thioredoxin